jgi:hypothetical protein
MCEDGYRKILKSSDSENSDYEEDVEEEDEFDEKNNSKIDSENSDYEEDVEEEDEFNEKNNSKNQWERFIQNNSITYVGVLTFPRSFLVNRPLYSDLRPFLNKNYCAVVIAEKCWIIPKLCLMRWKYFYNLKKYNKCNYFAKSASHFKNIYNMNVFFITNILFDSKVLDNINYATLDELPYLLQLGHTNCHPHEMNNKLRPFLELLLPPNIFWTDAQSA